MSIFDAIKFPNTFSTSNSPEADIELSVVDLVIGSM